MTSSSKSHPSLNPVQSTPSTSQHDRSVQGRLLVRDLLLCGMLMTVGAFVRWRLADLPNFAPIASLSLFAGVWIRWRLLAAAVPVGALLISDIALGLGKYEWLLMIAVYGSLSMPVMVAPWLKSLSRGRGRSWGSISKWLTATVGTALGGAVLFFVVTNAFVWFAWYDHTWQGLVACYGNALPFFRFTLAGDITFCVSFLIAHEITGLVAMRVKRRQPIASSQF